MLPKQRIMPKKKQHLLLLVFPKKTTFLLMKLERLLTLRTPASTAAPVPPSAVATPSVTPLRVWALEEAAFVPERLRPGGLRPSVATPGAASNAGERRRVVERA